MTEQNRASSGGNQLGFDLRYAVRSLRGTPALTSVALVIFALGIGAITAVFSVVDAVVLRPLPYADPDRIMAIRQATTPKLAAFSSVFPQDFTDWKSRQQAFQSLAAIAGGASLVDEWGAEPTSLHVARVSPSLFPTLGVAPELGRTFSSDREVTVDPNLVVISDEYWRHRFGADPGVVGRLLTLLDGQGKNRQLQIIGVMPSSFITPNGGGGFRGVLGSPTDLWLPLVIPAEEQSRGSEHNSYLDVIGRLKPGVNLELAQAEMTQISSAIVATYPSWYTYGGRALVYRLADWTIGPNIRAWMLMLFGAVSCVLLITFVNVANLLLARATARSREMAIRSALGAGRGRLARGLILEGLILSATGTVVALGIAFWVVAILKASLPASIPRAAQIGLNGRVFAAAAAAALFAGVGFGLVPIFTFSGASVTASLRDGRSGTASVTRQRLRSALVVGEVALAAALVVGAGLFVSSFVRLMSIDIGIDYRHVLTSSIFPTVTGATPEVRVAASLKQMEDVATHLKTLPGVSSVALFSGSLPFSGSYSRLTANVPSRPGEVHGSDDAVARYWVTPSYFETVRLPLLQGRSLADEDDRVDAEPVVLLSLTAARRYFGDGEAIGQQIAWNLSGATHDSRRVVGIVADMRPLGPEVAPTPEAYIPIAQSSRMSGTLMVRTTGDPSNLTPEVKAAVAATMPHRVVPQPESLERLFAGLIAQRRLNMLLVGSFGLLGLAIAVAGVYGVMSYVVEQRTQEIGVRIALGAASSQVLGMVLGRSLGLLCTGLAIGLGLSLSVARFVQAFLFQVSAYDWTVYGTVAVLLLIAGVCAAFLPARRAARVDPLIALRTE